MTDTALEFLFSVRFSKYFNFILIYIIYRGLYYTSLKQCLIYFKLIYMIYIIYIQSVHLKTKILFHLYNLYLLIYLLYVLYSASIHYAGISAIEKNSIIIIIRNSYF